SRDPTTAPNNKDILAMAETTKMELVTPGRVVASKPVEMVVIPGSEGVFGVLPRHSALLANLQRGVVEVYEGGKVIDRLMIDGGIADVTPDSVTILTERAEDLNKSNTQEIGERAKAASEAEADFLKDVEAAL
ncbi:MAG: ATP synthase F1 subunit epsilon, partial [Candidatus Puniceispirillaceae bacterium]